MSKTTEKIKSKNKNITLLTNIEVGQEPVISNCQNM